ncbi:hypothetical protein AB0299_17980, partial [Pseudarthrobacter sp. NPDC080037]
MSKSFTLSDVAARLGVSRSDAFRELQSWPHTRDGLEVSFTEEEVAAIEKMMIGTPDEHIAWLRIIEDQRAALRAKMKENQMPEFPDCCQWPLISAHGRPVNVPAG